jgi:hypothetical protein
MGIQSNPHLNAFYVIQKQKQDPRITAAMAHFRNRAARATKTAIRWIRGFIVPV